MFGFHIGIVNNRLQFLIRLFLKPIADPVGNTLPTRRPSGRVAAGTLNEAALTREIICLIKFKISDLPRLNYNNANINSPRILRDAPPLFNLMANRLAFIGILQLHNGPMFAKNIVFHFHIQFRRRSRFA